MKHPNLESLLDQYAREPLPTVPENVFADNVVRRIRIRNNRGRTSTYTSFQWSDLIRRPLVAFGAIAIAASIGVAPALLPTHDRQTVRDIAIIRESLGFEVFSSGVVNPLEPQHSETQAADSST